MSANATILIFPTPAPAAHPHLFNNLDFLVGTVCPLSLRLQTRVERLHWIFTKCPDLIPAGESVTCPWAPESRQTLTASSFGEDISFPGSRNPLWQNSWIELKCQDLEVTLNSPGLVLHEPVLLTYKWETQL